MAADKFNSLGGFSTGIPPIPVIDANGNVVSNFNNLYGNVSANKVYANSYFFSNGNPVTATPGGLDTQLQFNNAGSLGGISNVTWDGAILRLGDVSAVNLGGGLNGYVLQTDGEGNLSWTAQTGGGGGNGSPGGANAQVQYNKAGVFGGDAGFTYNDVTNTVGMENLNTTGNVNLGSVSNLTISGGTAGYFLRTEGAGNLTWAVGGGGGNGVPGGANTQVQFNDEETFAGDPTFTFDKSTGILSIPIVSATTLSASGIQTAGNVTAGNIKANGLANIAGNLRVSGNVNFSGAGNINLGTLSNVHISGGFNGYVLTTDGLGNLSWQLGGGGGNGNPSGANTQVQFNDNGLFGASPYFTYNNFNHTVTVGGNLIANTFQMGSGVYEFSTSEVYFASTSGSGPNQSLFSIPAANISGVEFHIIATESATFSRQSCKISSIVYNGQVQFNEYAGLQINGGVGSFSVDYDAGNIIVPPSVVLQVSPDSSNQIIYKMLITVFSS